MIDLIKSDQIGNTFFKWHNRDANLSSLLLNYRHDLRVDEPKPKHCPMLKSSQISLGKMLLGKMIERQMPLVKMLLGQISLRQIC